jgi:hypothetical protein
MVAQKLVQTGDAAKEIGIHWSKLDRLRKQGLIPEVVSAGRYFFYPAAQLAAIRARLIQSGHIDAGRERPLIPVQVADRSAALAAAAS